MKAKYCEICDAILTEEEMFLYDLYCDLCMADSETIDLDDIQQEFPNMNFYSIAND